MCKKKIMKMIETVILTIPKSKFRNLDGSAKLNFEAQQQDLKKGYAKWIKNPTKDMFESGKYYPRLTGYKRFSKYSVKIEFSAPKLIFGNNLEELQDNDFNKIIDTLYDRLLDMEIKTSKEDLAEARVSAIHYSKNIELQNNYTDFRYLNDGQSLQMYSKAHSFVIYDKMADLQKADRLAIDKDNNKMQRSLFDELPKEKEIEKKFTSNLKFVSCRLPNRRKFWNKFVSKYPKLNPLRNCNSQQCVYWQKMKKV
jgi:hypothetical protein